jgi:hypothetical protein
VRRSEIAVLRQGIDQAKLIQKQFIDTHAGQFSYGFAPFHASSSAGCTRRTRDRDGLFERVAKLLRIEARRNRCTHK